eukprot:g39324.t1
MLQYSTLLVTFSVTMSSLPSRHPNRFSALRQLWDKGPLNTALELPASAQAWHGNLPAAHAVVFGLRGGLMAVACTSGLEGIPEQSHILVNSEVKP